MATLGQAHCFQKVVTVVTDWTPDVEWGQEFRLWTSFPAMTALQLRTRLPKMVFVDELRRYLKVATGNYLRRYSTKEPLTFPSVTALCWILSDVWMDEEGWREPIQSFLTPNGVPFLPNVTRFAIRNAECSAAMLSVIVANIPAAFSKTRELKIFHSGAVSGKEERITDILLGIQIQLGRLEFNIFREDNTGWERILAKFAVTLETLIIRGVQDGPPLFLNLPVLPRLQLLKFSRPSAAKEKDTCRHLLRMKGVGAELKLKFGTGDKLDYATQFPVLHRLVVAQDPGQGGWDSVLVTSSIQFIYDNFLPLGQTPCETLTHLIIPTTQHLGNKWRLEQCKVCPFLQFREPGITKAAEMGAGFVDRVRETFPNLRNMGRYRHYLEKEAEMEEEREHKKEKMKEWLQFGEDLALITVSHDFSLDGRW